MEQALASAKPHMERSARNSQTFHPNRHSSWPKDSECPSCGASTVSSELVVDTPPSVPLQTWRTTKKEYITH